jgi:hypothetical protein
LPVNQSTKIFRQSISQNFFSINQPYIPVNQTFFWSIHQTHEISVTQPYFSLNQSENRLVQKFVNTVTICLQNIIQAVFASKNIESDTLTTGMTPQAMWSQLAVIPNNYHNKINQA